MKILSLNPEPAPGQVQTHRPFNRSGKALLLFLLLLMVQCTGKQDPGNGDTSSPNRTGTGFADFREDDYKEITWWDLLSADEAVFYENYDPYKTDENTEFPPSLPNPSVDGQKVKIPGYMVNLDGDFSMTSNFLLVPTMGACVHVPPPPENQIVYVETPEQVSFDLYIPVWVYGTVSVSSFSNEYAEGLYRLNAVKVEEYPIE